MRYKVRVEQVEDVNCHVYQFEYIDQAFAAVHALQFGDIHQIELEEDGKFIHIAYGDSGDMEHRKALGERNRLVGRLKQVLGDEELLHQELQEMIERIE